MKKFLLLFILISSTTFSQWFQRETGTNVFLTNGTFINNDCGYLVGEKGVLLKTTNGGNSWDKTIVDSTTRLNDIKILNDNYGSLIITAQNGNIYKSKDKGKTFEVITLKNNLPLRGISIYNNRIVVASGGFVGIDKVNSNSKINYPGFSYIFYSDDFGKTWNMVLNDNSFTAIYSEMINEDVWYVAGSNNIVIKTSDAGKTWSNITPYNAPYVWWYAAKFKDANIGYLVGGLHGSLGVAFKTTDGGSTWTNISPVADEVITNIDFIDENNITLVGGDYWHVVKNIIYKTYDGGKNWQVTSLSNLALYYVKMFNENNHLTCGKDGAVYITSNGGGSIIDTSFAFDVIQQGNGININSLVFDYQGNGKGFSDSGIVINYSDNGHSFDVDTIAQANLLVADYIGSKYKVGGQFGTLLYSEDGNTWKDNSFNSSDEITSISFKDNNIGFITIGNQLLRTDNNGLSWQFMDINSDLVKVKDSILVSVCLDSNIIMLSDNLGSNWNYLFTPFNRLTAISIYDRNNIVFSSELGEIYITDIEGTIRKLGSGNYRFNDIKHLDENSIICAGVNLVDGRGIVVRYNLSLKKLYGIKHFPSSLNSISIANNNWIAGNNGFLLFSENAQLPMPELMFTSVDIKNIDEIPSSFELEQNYPNPFNPLTNISFSLNKNEMVLLEIFDVQGRVIEILVDQQLKAGKYNVVFDGSGLASGTYFYRLISENNSVTKKLVLLK